jgi:2,4-dienoyl-CoA reductase-like NADH-dependent reductase (Old Yellow Enzyme family)
VSRYPRVATLKTAPALRTHLERSGIPLAFDDALAAPAETPLARPIDVQGVRVGNRFCILPMEGWDGTRNGEPSDLTRRRWWHFGISGAKLMWGGEAVAVRHDGRANPNQLLMTPATQPAIAALRETLVAAHRERFGANADGDLFIGLQLTHSGRYARPDVYDRPAPMAACANPVLDRRFPDGVRVIQDDELARLVDDFVAAARLARAAGFQFVDVKACHGYLGHELLGARGRGGSYGGSLENRTRFMRSVIEGIQANVPGLLIGVRLSVFDTVPYRKRADGVGEPDEGAQRSTGKSQVSTASARVTAGFGVVERDEELDAALGETRAVLRMLEGLGVRWICVTAGSPYYNPHIQRPAIFPPLDGYEPPEDPLRGVARQIQATSLLKRAFPGMAFVGSGYSYLQEWLPHVAQHNVREGLCDVVGLGRIALSYPELPADLLAGAPLRRSAFCRTFSDCTTGPRLGLVSGCYPLDAFYAARPEAITIRDVRTETNRSASPSPVDRPRVQAGEQSKEVR